MRTTLKILRLVALKTILFFDLSTIQAYEQLHVEYSLGILNIEVEDTIQNAISDSTILPIHQRNVSITSAYSNISKECFSSGLINDPLGLVEGRIPGVSINKAGGDPNKNFDARIRGISSIYGSNFPLIIIDGVYDAQLENLDPNDVESFEVIRDVAATAFYGIRGSNGVVIINTKKGRLGKIQVKYNTFFNHENAIRKHDIMSKSEFESFSYKMGIDNNRFGSETDWYNEILQPAGSQVHHLAVSGGSQHSNYYGSINYRGMNGVLKKTGFDRLNSRIHLEQKALNDRLTINLNAAVTQDKAELGNPRAFRYAPIYNPTASVRSEDPEYLPYAGYFQQVIFDYENPVALIEQTDHNSATSLINMQLSGSYQVFPNLEVRLLYAHQTGTKNTNLYVYKNSLNNNEYRNGFAEKQTNRQGFQILHPSVRWEENIGKAYLNIEGGYNYQEFISEGLNASGGNFLTDEFKYNRLSAADDFQNGRGEINSYKHVNKIIGFYSKFDLSFNNTYFFSLVGRYDGSSRFGENQKYGLYYGISAGVDLTRFLSWSKFNLLKPRIGYGKSGQDLHDNYLSLDLWEQGYKGLYYNGAYTNIYYMNNIGNEELKSPAKYELDIGVDFILLDGAIAGSFDYFTSSTKDLLVYYRVDIRRDIADHRWYNSGELINKGWEFALSLKAVQKASLSYIPSFILSRYLETSYGSLSDSDRDLEFDERWFGALSFGCCSGAIKMDEYSGVGEQWGLEFEGFSEDGEWIFKDQDGDGYANSYEDRIKIGDGLPDFELGWGNNIIYQQWDFQFFFKASFGYHLLNHYRLRYENPNFINRYNLSRRVIDMKNQNGTYAWYNGEYSTYFVDKGNYFKLANFKIGYSFSFQESSAIKDLNLYFMGHNLFVITNYKGSDPEVRYTTDNVAGEGAITPGIDVASDWLMTRSFAFGMNITF